MSYYIEFQKADFNTSWEFTNFRGQGHMFIVKVKDV